MVASPRRPLQVRIALIVLGLYIPFLIFLTFVPRPDGSVLDAPEGPDLVIDFVEGGAMIALLVIAFWALAQRRHWGRWFVAATLAYLIGNLAWGLIFDPVADPQELTDILTGASIGLSPLFLVVLLVSFGDEVGEYFASAQVNKAEGTIGPR